ncbi:short-chain dehydrogenase [Pontibacillus chungwhensis BH030062]|uniref:Short-chain dehydrogenase n=1 Tax=Pontibacillus chungwhensis BH030062 TaxID=1385513 RepID=A0A0A2UXT0_9BACI|nr:(S)-benzoin forming benzil reductase [Pontibacillus chungwhensis]KGP91573.1 short-chain dehydrogenase [Pontibacillus chungwhensis BH030062]
MNIAVITGVSKGLGESIAEKMMERGTHIIGVSRSGNKNLEKRAEANGVTYTHYACDLSSQEELLSVFSSIVENVKNQAPEKVYVVNNAGVVEPIDRVGSLDADQVVKHVHINLIAPMLVTNLVVEKLANIDVDIINVTSGAANRPVYGWSTYGGTKAGLNYFTETTAFEQNERGTKHRTVAFSPGVMDTDMQADIRSSSEEAFADVEKFKALKEEGKLRSTSVVAGGLMKLLDEGFESGEVYRVDQLLD